MSFSPPTASPQNGMLTVSSSATPNPSAQLSGTGVTAGLAFSQATMSFGLIGSGTSKTLQISLANYSTAPVTISTIGVTGPDSGSFSVNAGSCIRQLAVNQWCNISVTFAPTTVASSGATLTVNSTAATNPSATLSGTGVTPALALNLTVLHFGYATTGTTKSSTMTLYNYTATTVASTIGITGSSAFTVGPDNCSGKALPSNSYCNFTVNFVPGSSTGVLLSATVTVSSPLATNPSATVDGTGASAPWLSPAALAFGNEGLNVSSAPATVTISNYTGNTVTPVIPPADSTGAYTTVASPSCTGLVTNKTCSFTVTFNPGSTLGLNSSQLVVSVGGSNLTVTLTGTGVQLASLSPGTLAFGNEGLNVPSTPKSVTIYNYTGNTVTPVIPAADSTGAYTTAVPPSCTSLATNKFCTFTVTFNPGNTLGAIPSSLLVTVGGSNLTVTLTGTGVQLASLSPATLAFGNEGLNVPSVPKSVTVYNYTGNTVSGGDSACGLNGRVYHAGAAQLHRPGNWQVLQLYRGL